ncbi:hypothetical protein [Streptomyces sp. NPDC049879]|uniref:hypothetical protein n=1 Tax=Streptomyces sp. NPDC049879 TaxID=3365598 RepID=UPI00378A46E1
MTGGVGVPPLLAAVHTRDGQECTAGPRVCWERATAAVPRDPGVGLVDAVRLGAGDLIGACREHARERAAAAKRARDATLAARLAEAQLDLFAGACECPPSTGVWPCGHCTRCDTCVDCQRCAGTGCTCACEDG